MIIGGNASVKVLIGSVIAFGIGLMILYIHCVSNDEISARQSDIENLIESQAEVVQRLIEANKELENRLRRTEEIGNIELDQIREKLRILSINTGSWTVPSDINFTTFWLRPRGVLSNGTISSNSKSSFSGFDESADPNNFELPLKVVSYFTYWSMDGLCPLWTSAILQDVEIQLFMWSLINADSRGSNGQKVEFGGKSKWTKNFLQFLSELDTIPDKHKTLPFLDAYDTFIQCSAKQMSSLPVLQNRFDNSGVFRGVVFAAEDYYTPDWDMKQCEDLYGRPYNNKTELMVRLNHTVPVIYLNSGIIVANPADWYKEWINLEQDTYEADLNTNDQKLAQCLYAKNKNRTLEFNTNELFITKDDYAELSWAVADGLGVVESYPFLEDGMYKYKDVKRGDLIKTPCILHADGNSKVRWKDKWIAYFENKKPELTRKIKEVKGGLKRNWIWDLHRNEAVVIEYDEICNKNWARRTMTKPGGEFAATLLNFLH